MALEFSKGLEQELSPKFRKILEEHEPYFGNLNQRTRVIGVKDVGSSFEPRMQVTYNVFFGEENKGKYSQILVLNKDGSFCLVMYSCWGENSLFLS